MNLVVYSFIQRANTLKMSKEQIKELKNLIKSVSLRISQLKSKIGTCEKSSRMYNRLLIERACMRKKLKELESRNLVAILRKNFRKKFMSKSQRKLICDYFN